MSALVNFRLPRFLSRKPELGMELGDICENWLICMVAAVEERKSGIMNDDISRNFIIRIRKLMSFTSETITKVQLLDRSTSNES